MSKLPEAAPIPDAPPLHIKGGNLVVASPESIVDACFAAPAVRALRNARPTATLAVLTPESIAPLWRTVAGIKKLIEYPDGAPLREIAKLVKTCGIKLETSFVWEDSDAARSLAKARIGQRIGYDIKGLNKKLTDALEVDAPEGPTEHHVRFYMNLMQKLGIEGYTPTSFETPPLPPRPNPPRIGLVPGSILGPSYRWDVDKFRELAEALLARNCEPIILAYPGRANESNELANRLGERVRNFSNDFDLTKLLGALPHCSLVVANDSAVAHLAAHVGVPTVAIFGPGDPEATRPLGRIHTVVSQHVECSPCHKRSCPLDHHRCMEELTTDRVLAAIGAYFQPPQQQQQAPPAS